MFSKHIRISLEITHVLDLSLPIVALESTVITHGLPIPQNMDLARDMEAKVRKQGATPATVALLDGRIRIGINDEELERLANAKDPVKVSRRDFAKAIVKKLDGGTTVAGTMLVAQQVGIKVFATGGIGGVHREGHMDISTDLQALADTPMIVVCAGAKSILDLPATLEYLETMAVPVVGYGTDEFPAFFSRKSGSNVSVRLNSPEEIVAFAKAHWDLGLKSAVLVTNPIPEKHSLDDGFINPIITQASQDAQNRGIHGQALTPFLLARINELSGGRSLKSNLVLLHNNATLAAKIAKVMTQAKGRKIA
ncbi:MAG: pseudouridine-5'-phosphate glycosidase [Anaerolineae bacterium]|jgi:pseudouridine-5'-phosphate glycosidase|nr:pseudouridine-5'-phosphate glycosidase [Anaerolineae bacterium]MBT4309186.1 pseudouridine-5'-phosphate glycosidase [Anaerolineae bacterium]MBT4459627.1 pseudouridine-5'-phosphate glycosidase [Anaerolineae bacterium]MBT4841616.1 pseudouridine-5'-phosphate glycosidase [Anaerolineae bacterium]MBT6060201.1 pseudouridine-5'-phosphate glycosidase [Anaerolineae bacterium]